MALPCRGEEVWWHRDPPDGMELAPLHKTAVPLAEIDTIAIDMLEPGVSMAFGKDEEQPLGLDRGAGFERLGETAWP